MKEKSEKHEKYLEKLHNMNQKGKNNRNWKGGYVINGDGYKMIKQKGHPRANKDDYVFEHIIIMEKYIGRYLTDSEEVHHINEIKTDNRPENLTLFTNHSEHMIFNHNMRRWLKSVPLTQ
jgi:uncharacterized protein (UPF0297 family)